MPSTQPTREPMFRNGFKPRLDLTLVAFALAGVAVAAVLPQRIPADGRYALAISHGDDLRLAGRAESAGTLPDPGARVLSCKRVVSVGPVDVGARCRPGELKPVAGGQTTAAAD